MNTSPRSAPKLCPYPTMEPSDIEAIRRSIFEMYDERKACNILWMAGFNAMIALGKARVRGQFDMLLPN
jgi:hypothetical protein